MHKYYHLLLIMSYKELPTGHVALVVKDEEGRVCQLSMTIDQNIALQSFVKKLSETKPLMKMGPDYDLVLKSTVKKFKKNMNINHG